MLTAVAESAQVALQAGTVAGKADNRSSDRLLQSPGVRRPRDTVTISPEAVQMTRAALDATETAHERPPDDEEEPAGEKEG